MGEEWEAKLKNDGLTKRKIRFVGRGEEFDVAVWVMKEAEIPDQLVLIFPKEGGEK